MDLSFVKQKLASNANKGKKYEKIDYSKIFWKPTVGSHQIRIVPNKFIKNWPLREIQMHYGFTKGPILALTNWGESDPIVTFVQSLRKSSEKDDWTLANKISPKTRYFAPVIVRGQEEAGVRLWEVGKLVNDQLMGIANNPDYGDFTDITDGRDFTVEAVKDVVANKEVIKSTLLPRVKTTPISEDSSLVTKWLEEQPDILSINRHYKYDDLKEVLQKWLEPGDEDVAKTSEEVIPEEGSAVLPGENEHVAVAPAKVGVTDKFEELFK